MTDPKSARFCYSAQHQRDTFWEFFGVIWGAKKGNLKTPKIAQKRGHPSHAPNQEDATKHDHMFIYLKGREPLLTAALAGRLNSPKSARPMNLHRHYF
jgi:hypothetical protein